MKSDSFEWVKENEINLWYYNMPFGVLGIGENKDGITNVFLKGQKEPENSVRRQSDILDLVAKEILEYFGGHRQQFDLPLSLRGTPFQIMVWNTLISVPYGETRSYGEIATAIENPKACRAVGMANHRNPAMILVPCHRIIGKSGTLVGYAGGLELKQQLISLEKKYK